MNTQASNDSAKTSKRILARAPNLERCNCADRLGFSLAGEHVSVDLTPVRMGEPERPLLERIGEFQSQITQACESLKGIGAEIEARKELARRRMGADEAFESYEIRIILTKEGGKYRASHWEPKRTRLVTAAEFDRKAAAGEDVSEYFCPTKHVAETSELRLNPKVAVLDLVDRLDQTGVFKE